MIAYVVAYVYMCVRTCFWVIICVCVCLCVCVCMRGRLFMRTAVCVLYMCTYEQVCLIRDILAQELECRDYTIWTTHQGVICKKYLQLLVRAG